MTHCRSAGESVARRRLLLALFFSYTACVLFAIGIVYIIYMCIEKLTANVCVYVCVGQRAGRCITSIIRLYTIYVPGHGRKSKPVESARGRSAAAGC